MRVVPDAISCGYKGMMNRMDPVQIAVVGVGGWGKNLARNFHQLPDANLKYVCDLDQKKLDQGGPPAARHDADARL